MKPLALLGLLISVFISNVNAHAEGRCPAGYYPVDTPGVLGCAPIPGYGGNQQHPPPPPQWSDRYGAIAVGTSGGVGTSTNMLSRQDAEQSAMADCQAKAGENCKIRTWYGNRCAAMAVDANTGAFNVLNRDTLNEAEQASMENCSSDGGTKCRVYYSACSLPFRIR